MRLGRTQEALGWYATVPAPVFPGEWRLAASHYQRGVILDELGDTQAAIEHYSTFTDLWTDADPACRSRVAAACARVLALRQRE